MTIREFLIKKKRRYFASAIAPLIVGIVSLQAWVLTGRIWLSYVGLALLGLCILGVLGYKFLVRCPRCGGDIGRRYNHFSAKPFLFLRPVANCPTCGVSLEAPVDAQ